LVGVRTHADSRNERPLEYKPLMAKGGLYLRALLLRRPPSAAQSNGLLALSVFRGFKLRSSSVSVVPPV